MGRRLRDDSMTPQMFGMIGGLLATLWFPTITLAAVYLFRRLQSQERLKAIEKGLDLAFDPVASAASSRKSGIVLIAAGIGIAAATGIVTWVAHDREALVGLALAIVPVVVGVGLLIESRIQRNDASR
jgi:hypothetical protein